MQKSKIINLWFCWASKEILLRTFDGSSERTTVRLCKANGWPCLFGRLVFTMRVRKIYNIFVLWVMKMKEKEEEEGKSSKQQNCKHVQKRTTVYYSPFSFIILHHLLSSTQLKTLFLLLLFQNKTNINK